MLLRRASGELRADGGVPGNRSAGNSAEQAMKIRLEIRKNGETVFEGVLDAIDAEKPWNWADVWNALSRQSAEAATSIGALYERLNERVPDQLNGAEIRLTRM